MFCNLFEGVRRTDVGMGFTVRMLRRSIAMGTLTLLVASGCATGERPVLAPKPQPSTTEPAAGLTADAEAALANDEAAAVDAGPVRALVTPTGIVVPVLGQDESGYQIVTPCGLDGSIVWGTPIRQARVALDPGHGGDVETGAVGPNGLAEKDLNLDVVKRAARLLEDRGISVVLTRTADYRVPLAVRAQIGNELDVEVMVSVHHNAPTANRSAIPGTEIFVQLESDESRRLGGILYEEIVSALTPFDVAWTTAPDAGALAVINGEGENSYGMVRRPLMPAVLAEFGYLSNQPEADLFATEAYLEAASLALADGVERFLETEDAGSGFIDEPRQFSPGGGTGGSNGCVDPPLE